MIKVATLEDLDIVLELGEKFIKEAGYDKLTSKETYENLAKLFLTGDRHKYIVLLFEDKGILGGLITPTPFGDGLVASEMIWWVDKSERSKEIGSQLLQAFEYWAKTVGANHVSMTCIDDRVGQFYEKIGFNLFQKTYIKEI